MTHSAPNLDAITQLRASLAHDIVRTPLMRCAGLESLLDDGSMVYGKLEFLQRTGTFKARGALAVIRGLSREQLAAGVTAVSAGNHAIATAFAAKAAGTSAKVVMIASANAYRINACRSYGADVVLADDAHTAFEMAERIKQQEGRFFVHPFDGEAIATGTGTVGLEICEQCDNFDAVVVSVGGGGLIGGIGNAVKQLRPACEVIGVETNGADSMHRSLEAGEPVSIDRVDTIADSLGAPFALPYSFELCQRYVDRMAMVSDLNLQQTMGLLFKHMKLAVEPACAASTAALLGPLRELLRGKRIVLVFCGSNIDWDTYSKLAILN
ncbi:MAG: pyridoxal-phosphate dependent enzyme [Gammaproteobacteria bacterium]|nr:pyridoxal-phosphate dependent enzyme [Gammaproteobacteria bacterium]